MPWWVPPRCRVSVGRTLGGVGLLRRLGSVEGVDFHAFPENARDRRHAFGTDVEELRTEDLGGEADVGERRRVAVAEPAGFPFLAEVLIERPERLQRPVRKPFIARGFVMVQLLLKVTADPRTDQRVSIADDDLRETANARAAARIL